MEKTSQAQPRKRGVRDFMVALVSAFMIMSPVYFADILINRLKIPMSAAAIFALGVFLVGIFLLIRVLRD